MQITGKPGMDNTSYSIIVKLPQQDRMIDRIEGFLQI